MSTATDLSTLTINYLTQVQYDVAVQAGTDEHRSVSATRQAAAYKRV